jgi:formylglycine-generating enzyme required for sulfatase activity
MPEESKTVRVVVVCPGDVADERERVRRIAADIERSWGDWLGLSHMRVWSWDTDAHPGFHPQGAQGVIDEQMKITDCDLVIGIFWQRLGTRDDKLGGKTGTEHEIGLAEEALKNSNRPAVWIYVSDRPPEIRETSGWFGYAQLKEYVDEVGRRGLVRHYLLPEEFGDRVRRDLEEYLKRRFPPARGAAPPPPVVSPDSYIEWLRSFTSQIDLRGLKVRGEVRFVDIDKFYIPLRVRAGDGSLPLEAALRKRLALIEGGPGSGKSTFLRRIAWELVREGGPVLGIERGLPLLLRVADLEGHIAEVRASHTPGAPVGESSPYWIPHYLGERHRGLDVQFWESQLKESSNILLLDGLDEASNAAHRQAMIGLMEEAQRLWPCRMVVTTRPENAAVACFERSVIEELDDAARNTFLDEWCRQFPSDDTEYRSKLGEALRANKELRRLAGNPLMLTALAVVHHNNKQQLPDQRAELYELVVGYLAESRRHEGRAAPGDCLRRLGVVALAMQEWKGGYRKSLGVGDAAKLLEAELPKPGEAEDFLEAEQKASGILTLRGHQIEFWHRSFQEYLAARTLAGLREQDQVERALRLLPQREAREVMQLLAGCMQEKHRDQLDFLFQQLIEHTANQKKLAAKAYAFGVLGAMLADLRPTTYALPPASKQQLDEAGRAVLAIFEPSGAQGVGLKTRVEAAEALGAAGDPRLHTPWEKEYWVYIPGGKFWIGAQKTNPRGKNYDKEAYADEAVREVQVREFWMGRFPVTVQEYARYLDGTGAAPPDEWEDWQVDYPNRPVRWVDWHQASAYCQWAGGRLPSEEEWEFAARGVEGRKYPWGEPVPDETRANFDMKVGEASPGGLFPLGATPEGLLDMAGNVWEWTNSDYGAGTKVARGASFSSNSRNLRAAYRNSFVPAGRYYAFGFRCVRDISP